MPPASGCFFLRLRLERKTVFSVLTAEHVMPASVCANSKLLDYFSMHICIFKGKPGKDGEFGPPGLPVSHCTFLPFDI